MQPLSKSFDNFSVPRSIGIFRSNPAFKRDAAKARRPLTLR